MLKSRKLNKSSKIIHCFFSRKNGVSKGIYKSLNCGPGSEDNKSSIIKNLNIAANKAGFKKKNLVLLKQIHSNKLFKITKLPKKKLKGDGLITNVRKIALGILTADCAPVFIYDKKKNKIGALHAGWRGALKKIVFKMLDHFTKSGSKVEDLIAVVGPSIAQKNYEVKMDFKKEFLKQSKRNIRFFKIKRNKIYFSLGQYIYNQFIDYGLKNIDLIKKDTYTKNNNFFSARRALKNKFNDYGRNLSVIMIK